LIPIEKIYYFKKCGDYKQMTEMLSLFWYYVFIRQVYKGGLFIQENYKTFMGLSQNKTEDFSNIQCPAVHEHFA
jgi:hypothetical protein